ncbi:hypothetical protein [Microvirga sp. P5_D2]
MAGLYDPEEAFWRTIFKMADIEVVNCLIEVAEIIKARGRAVS